jgi:putative ABC transport system ATP-binding protein
MAFPVTSFENVTETSFFYVTMRTMKAGTRVSARRCRSKKERKFMEILRTENLCKTYGKDDNAVQAVKDANIMIEKGEFVAVVGSSGSGKSTLMHMLGGVDRPTSGKVFVENEDIYAMNDDRLAVFRRRQVGLIYQFYNLIPVLNVEENITLPCELDGKEVDKALLEELLGTLGLDKVRMHLPNELSGGQQQRVAIGRSLITRPAILLADEPTGNLDTKNGNEIMELLKASNRKYKQTIIMITHNLELAKQADRILVMEDGMVRESGSVKAAESAQAQEAEETENAQA